MSIIKPTWPCPHNIRAFTTTRQNGCSKEPYASFNLGLHVGDEEENVIKNRTLLHNTYNLPNEPLWLKQTHSDIAIEIKPDMAITEADAAYTKAQKTICAVLTADCLPVLITNQQGTEIAAIHAGWRGLLKGIIENTLQKLTSSPETLLVWLGPAIGPQAYEVGAEVQKAFVNSNKNYATAFQALPQPDKYLIDIYAIAKDKLLSHGIKHIYGGDFCTFTDSERFFSYRRDGITGRMVSLVWIE